MAKASTRPAAAPKRKPLSPRRRRYARARAAGKTMAEAAKAAGYTGRRAEQRVTGSEIERDPQVKALISDLIEQAMPVQELLERIADQACVDVADFVTLVDQPLLSEAAKTLRASSKPGMKAAADKVAEIANAGFFVDIPKAIRAGKSHLIEQIGFDKQGRPKLVAVGSHQAQKLLAQIRGLLRERVEHSGPDGGPIEVTRIERAIVRSDGAG